jgi:hypothetical protein
MPTGGRPGRAGQGSSRDSFGERERGYTVPSRAPVAQGIERCPAEAEVASSNLAGRTEFDGDLGRLQEPRLGGRAEEALATAAFVVAVTAVVQDGPLGGKRRRSQDDAGEQGADEHGAPAPDPSDDVHRVAPPVHRPVAQRAR